MAFEPSPTVASLAPPSSTAGSKIKPSGSAVRGHMLALDGLRGIAILPVMLTHLAAHIHGKYDVWGRAFRFASTGWWGVDLFFVLSGFLITGILYDSKSSKHFFRNFYMRRALRIFPLYYGTLLTLTLLQHSVPSSEINLGSDWVSQTAAWTYFTNVVIAFRGFAEYSWIGHFWSLSVEEHFYFLWPVLIFWLSRRAAMRIALLCIAIPFVLRCGFLVGGANPEAISALTPFRVDALAVGALTALAMRGPEGIEVLQRTARFVGIASLGGIASIVALHRDLLPQDPMVQSIGYTCMAFFFGAVLIESLSFPTGYLAQALKSRLLRTFGKYSYGLYVLHGYIFALALSGMTDRWLVPYLGSMTPAAEMTAALFFTGLIAFVSWHVYEKQFLRLKTHFELKPVRTAHQR